MFTVAVQDAWAGCVAYQPDVWRSVLRTRPGQGPAKPFGWGAPLPVRPPQGGNCSVPLNGRSVAVTFSWLFALPIEQHALWLGLWHFLGRGAEVSDRIVELYR